MHVVRSAKVNFCPSSLPAVTVSVTLAGMEISSEFVFHMIQRRTGTVFLGCPG